MERLHATAVAIDGRALLLTGPSGAGKSDLALRLIDDGAELLADDQVELRMADGKLWAQAPAALFGMIEVRGLGLVRLPACKRAPVAAVIRLVAAAQVERLPEPGVCRIQNVTLPRYDLAPFAASATIKVRLILRNLQENSMADPEESNRELR